MDATNTGTDQRLRKSERLLTKRQFDVVFRVRCSASDDLLILYAAPNHLDQGRLGMAVGRAYGNAVARNAFKRRIRESFRLNKAGGEGFDLVVLPRVVRKRAKPGHRRAKAAPTPDFGSLQQSFLDLRARVIERCGRQTGTKAESDRGGE